MNDWSTLASQLRRDGFCVVADVLGPDLLRRLRLAGDAAGERWTERMGDVFRSQGSMVSTPYMDDPAFGELIAHPATIEAFELLGLGGARFTAGYVISKPGGSPPLFWHFDWYLWDDPSSLGPDPRQLFVMYYLTDTRRQNGCLRVIPGSHVARHPLHDVMADGHKDLRSADDLARPEFADWPEAIDVPVRAGDAVLGDARLLHAAHANRTDERRSLVTLWYHPHFDELSDSAKATFMGYRQALPESWPATLRDTATRLHPSYDGDAEALPRTHHGPRPGAAAPVA